MNQPYQRHKAAKEAYEFMRRLYNALDRATKMDANGVKGIFIPRDVATPLVADTKAAADKMQSLLEHWSSADTGDTAGDVEKTAAAVMNVMAEALEDGDTNSGGRDTRSPKRPKS